MEWKFASVYFGTQRTHFLSSEWLSLSNLFDELFQSASVKHLFLSFLKRAKWQHYSTTAQNYPFTSFWKRFCWTVGHNEGKKCTKKSVSFKKCVFKDKFSAFTTSKHTVIKLWLEIKICSRMCKSLLNYSRFLCFATITKAGSNGKLLTYKLTIV